MAKAPINEPDYTGVDISKPVVPGAFMNAQAEAFTNAPAETNVQRVAREQAERDASYQAIAGADPLYNKSVVPTSPTGYRYQWIGATNGGKWTLQPTASTIPGGDTGAGTGTGTTGSTAAKESTGPTLAKDTFKKTLGIFFGQAETSKPWMDALYNYTAPFYKSGSTMDEALNMALQSGRTDPALKTFTDRFSGIFKLQDKLNSGAAVSVPTIAEFSASEAKMGDVLNAAGLGELNTQEFLNERIGSGLNVAEFTNRINDVYQGIESLPAEAKQTINRYMPSVDKTQLAKAILTGTTGAAELAKNVAGYQVLAAGEAQGLGALTNAGTANLTGGLGLTQANELAARGYTYNTANTAFSTVAQELPTYNFLNEIDKKTAVDKSSSQQELIDANMKQLASAQRAKAQTIALEAARFSGQSGTSKGSFSSGYLNRVHGAGAF